MRKIMVCVTEQKTCDRLIMFGHDLMLSKNDELYIIHISRSEFKIYDVLSGEQADV